MVDDRWCFGMVMRRAALILVVLFIAPLSSAWPIPDFPLIESEWVIVESDGWTSEEWADLRNQGLEPLRQVSETEGVFNFKNTYASPQRIIQVTGSTPEKIITTINQNMNAIYSALYFNEIQEKQRRIAKNLNQTQAIKKSTGLTLRFPSAYRVAKVDTNFVWIRREIETGSINLFISRYNDKNLSLIHI